MAKSHKMTYREWPNTGRLIEICQIPPYDKPKSQKRFEETKSLTLRSSSWDEWFQHVQELKNAAGN